MGDSNKDCSRDFLKRFSETSLQSTESITHPKEEIELNLGLSLGGRFGVDRKLVRSTSSVTPRSLFKMEVDLPEEKKENLPGSQLGRTSSLPGSQLARTGSLPVVSEEVLRRKELQTARRMEVKRKRDEKLKNVPPTPPTNGRRSAVASGSASSSGSRYAQGLARVPSVPVERAILTSPGSANPAARVPSVPVQQDIQPSPGSAHPPAPVQSVPVPQAIQPSPVSAHPPAPVQSVPVQQAIQPSPGSSNPPAITVKVEAGGPSNKSRGKRKKTGDIGTEGSQDMPSVFTYRVGNGGGIIEGFLYNFMNGKELRIVCVCHGDFHTPADFVRHAGGGDVAHPMRHIVMSDPNSKTI